MSKDSQIASRSKVTVAGENGTVKKVEGDLLHVRFDGSPPTDRLHILHPVRDGVKPAAN